MKKRIMAMLCVLSVCLWGCSFSEDHPLSWKVDRIEEDTIYFCNGIRVILPENYRDAFEIVRYDEEEDTVNGSSSVWICEKQNHKAGYGGDMFFLRFRDREEEMMTWVLSREQFLGVYRVGEEEYALICGPTGEGSCGEEEELIEAWQNLFQTVDEIQVVTSGLEGYEDCDIEEVDWIEYY